MGKERARARNSQREEGKGRVGSRRRINLWLAKPIPCLREGMHSHLQAGDPGQLCLLVCFPIFLACFFCNKTNEAEEEDPGWQADLLSFLPSQARHSRRMAVGRGSETEPRRGAQSQDFWQSRFPYSLLPAPNPTLTHFTAPTFNLPNATKPAN